MKYSKIIVVIAVATIGLLFWLTNKDSDLEKFSPVTLDPRVSLTPKQQENIALAEKLLEVEQPLNQSIDEPQQIALQEELNIKKQEIDRNIQLLTENLYNQEERVVIQARLAVLLEDYNQSALPLILNEMSAKRTQ